jgi:hypothetical protein
MWDRGVITAFNFFPFQSPIPFLRISSQCIGMLSWKHLCISAFQILLLKPQQHKRWSRLSITLLQIKQWTSPFPPHSSNMSPVDWPSLIATQRMKACLGRTIENHTRLHQSTSGFFALNSSHVSLLLYVFDFVAVHIGKSLLSWCFSFLGFFFMFFALVFLVYFLVYFLYT